MLYFSVVADSVEPFKVPLSRVVLSNTSVFPYGYPQNPALIFSVSLRARRRVQWLLRRSRVFFIFTEASEASFYLSAFSASTIQERWLNRLPLATVGSQTLHQAISACVRNAVTVRRRTSVLLRRVIHQRRPATIPTLLLPLHFLQQALLSPQNRKI